MGIIRYNGMWMCTQQVENQEIQGFEGILERYKQMFEEGFEATVKISLKFT